MKLFILHTKNIFFFVLAFLLLYTVMPVQVQAQGSIKWPLKVNGGNQESVQKIFGGYGMYDADAFGASIHFHEGLDLIAESGTMVYASEDGIVVNVDDKLRNAAVGHYLNFIIVSRGTDDTTAEALLYLHMIPKGNWKIGDTVRTGNELGSIYKHPTVAIDPHLHFGWHNRGTGNWKITIGVDPVGPDQNGNPIDILSNRSDPIAPVIDAIRYRSQTGEGLAAAPYFTQKTASNDTVVKNDVDIVARIGEKFNNFPGINYNLNVTRLQFSVQEYKPGTVAQVPTQNPIAFMGLFLSGCNPFLGRNTHLKHYNEVLVHKWYENDNTCKSIPRASTGPDKGSYWYIITNKDTLADDKLKDNSQNYSWYTKSKAVPGVKWNNLYRDAERVADSNKNAEYPDGRYILTLRAWGYGHPLVDWTSHNDTMFINNHDEFIFSCDAAGKLKDEYCPGEAVYITGKGYPKNRRIYVYLFKDADWNDGTFLNILDPKFTVGTSVVTDADGRIQPFKLWNAYVPNGDPDKGYDIIIDYDDDVYYTAVKEGKTVDVLDATPGPYSIIGKKLMIAPNKIDVSCFGECDGSIALTVTGGKAPYKYYWNDILGYNTQPGRDSLCAGTYIVTVSDAEGCLKSDTIVIEQPNDLFVSCSGTPATCDSCNGTATMVAGGGRPPYTYSWPGGRLTGLCPGTYTGYVTDSSGCTDSCTVTIYRGYSNLTAYCSGSPATCDSCNGSATISAYGGVPPYTYSWPGGRLTGLCPGTYTGTVTDAVGCRSSCTVTIGSIGRIVMGTQGLIRTRLCDTIIVDTAIVDTIIHVDITQPGPINRLPDQVTINKAYPNPFTTQANIEFTSTSTGNAQVLVQNVTGSLVQQYTIKTQKGKNITRIDGTNLPPGIYFIKITTSNSVAIKLYRR